MWAEYLPLWPSYIVLAKTLILVYTAVKRDALPSFSHDGICPSPIGRTQLEYSKLKTCYKNLIVMLCILCSCKFNYLCAAQISFLLELEDIGKS